MARPFFRDVVDLWVVEPERIDDPELLRRYESLLTADEAKRRDDLRFEKHRHEFLLTRALVRSVLSEYCDKAPADWRFASNEYGRPETVPPCGLSFNLSNTPTLVVCAVSGHPVIGVDVEPLARADDILEVAETVFSPPELAALAALASAAKHDRAVSLWTLKEAYIKARGMGLSLPLREITLRFEDEAPPVLELGPSLGEGGAEWWLTTLDVAQHRVALAVRAGQGASIRVNLLPTTPLAGGAGRAGASGTPD